MKKLFYFLFTGFFTAILFFGSCEKVVYPPIEKPKEVSYAQQVQPIRDAKCVSCHGGGTSPNLKPDVSHGQLIGGGYIDIATPAESKLMQKLYGSHDARASEMEKQTILAWIEEGAKNN